MPRSRAIVRGRAALFLLIVLLVGVPLALAHFVGWPLPRHFPDYDAVLTSVQRTGVRDDSVVKALSIVVWLTWVCLAVGVVVEAIGLARSRPPVQRRSLGSVQRLAGGLVASVALLTGPAAVHGAPPVGSVPLRPTPAAVAAVSAGQHTVPAAITVHRGDTLTSLAADALGDPTRWPDLWRENSGRRFGRVTFDDPNLILPGWDLRLPAPAAAHPVAEVAQATQVARSADAPVAATSAAVAVAPSSAPVPKAAPVVMVRPAANRATDEGSGARFRRRRGLGDRGRSAPRRRRHQHAARRPGRHVPRRHRHDRGGREPSSAPPAQRAGRRPTSAPDAIGDADGAGAAGPEPARAAHPPRPGRCVGAFAAALGPC